MPLRAHDQKNVRNPNHHYFAKKYRNTPPKKYCNTPPICIALLLVPYALRKGKYCQYSSHLYRSTPLIVLQYASHLYRSTTFGKILVVVVTGMFPTCQQGDRTKVTERAPNADFRRKPQIFADSPLLLEIQAFGGRRFSQETADFRRKPQETADWAP